MKLIITNMKTCDIKEIIQVITIKIIVPIKQII